MVVTVGGAGDAFVFAGGFDADDVSRADEAREVGVEVLGFDKH